ncbi:MAG: hypothetical protein R3F06_11600 [Nitrosomonas sp.]
MKCNNPHKLGFMWVVAFLMQYIERITSLVSYPLELLKTALYLND